MINCATMRFRARHRRAYSRFCARVSSFGGAGNIPIARRRARKRLTAAFRASGDAVEAFLRERLQSGKRIGFFQGKPIRWMCYLIAHDSHHRGQIALALKQNGMRLPEKAALREIWYPWYGRDF